MSQSEQQKQQQKVVQYLNEAHASEQALDARAAVADRDDPARVLPLRRWRRTCDETREHAERVGRRLQALGQGSNPLMAVVGVVETRRRAGARARQDAVRSPARLRRRGEGAQERQGRVRHRGAGDRHLHRARAPRPARSATTRPPSWPRRSSPTRRRCSQRVLREIPKLTDAVVGADVKGKPSYDVATTGAAEAVREAGEATKQAARKTTAATKRTARQARKVPGVAQAEGQIKGAVASEGDLAIARYDSLTADEITGRLTELSQIDLAKVDSYERTQPEPHHGPEPHHARCAATSRGRATTSSRPPRSRPCSPRATTSAPSRSAPTSAPTRTAPASSRPPSASSATPDPGTPTATPKAQPRAGPSPYSRHIRCADMAARTLAEPRQADAIAAADLNAR